MLDDVLCTGVAVHALYCSTYMYCTMYSTVQEEWMYYCLTVRKFSPFKDHNCCTVYSIAWLATIFKKKHFDKQQRN